MSGDSTYTIHNCCSRFCVRRHEVESRDCGAAPYYETLATLTITRNRRVRPSCGPHDDDRRACACAVGSSNCQINNPCISLCATATSTTIRS